MNKITTNQQLVLDAIKQGITTDKEIAKQTGLRIWNVTAAHYSLINKGLVTVDRIELEGGAFTTKSRAL